MKPIFNMTGLETKEGDKENVTIFDYGLAGQTTKLTRSMTHFQSMDVSKAKWPSIDKMNVTDFLLKQRINYSPSINKASAL